MKLLIIEDDDRIAEPLKEDFEKQHNFVQLAGDGATGLQYGLEQHFDVIILDLMLPEMDGMTVCQRLRQSGCRSAIIMLTARRKTGDKIVGLDCGADDYLTKPFELDELSARIRAVLRRGTESRQPIFRHGKLSLNPNTFETTYGDMNIELTPTEFRLLENFLASPNRAFSKEELIDKFWSEEHSVSEYVVKTHVKGLRKKLVSAGAPKDIVETLYGLGYRLKRDA
ncbi:MAG TPA: response regulator transcription factor [Planktothrix sp.]|jgi:DNA-binding response OmpR family regulator